MDSELHNSVSYFVVTSIECWCPPSRDLLSVLVPFTPCLSAGPVSSILVNRYGSRPVVMIGGLLVGVGMVTASFGTTIMHLYLCVGVIGGTFVTICENVNGLSV